MCPQETRACRLGRLAGCLGSTSGSQTSQLACSLARGELLLWKRGGWQTSYCTMSRQADQQRARVPFTAVQVSVHYCHGGTALPGDVVSMQGMCGLRQHMFFREEWCCTA